jgi:cytochrome P450
MYPPHAPTITRAHVHTPRTYARRGCTCASLPHARTPRRHRTPQSTPAPASAFPAARPHPCASWLDLDSIHEAEAHAAELRDAEVAYCKDLLWDLHERLDAGDPTPSQMEDLLRTIEDGTLTLNEELRLATTLTGSGMSSGTSLTWLAPHLAPHPELQEKAYHVIEDVYGGEPPDPLDTDRLEYIKALGTGAGRYFA